MNVPQVSGPVDDGLPIAMVGGWGRKKYDLISRYASMFTKAMRQKWANLVYVDLFSGPGVVRFKDTRELGYGSPLLSLTLPTPFDCNVFCEADPEALAALKARVTLLAPAAKVHYVDGDVNLKTADILGRLPTYSKAAGALGFCVADPYKLANLKFATIKALSARLMDFLVLLPTGMDANRNWESTYLSPSNAVLADFIGCQSWRQAWASEKKAGKSVDVFLADLFGAEMSKLGYIYPGASKTELVRLPVKNVPLYRLAFFSKDKLGVKFWNESRRYSTQQLELFP